MQPNSDEWQQPSEPTTNEPHSYINPESTTNPEPVTSDDQATDPPAPEPSKQSVSKTFEGDEELVRWQAVEHIHHDKNTVWYIVFGLVTVGFILLGALVFKSILFTILVPLMAVALIGYTLRPPELLTYTLSRKGLHVEDKLYPFEDFKEFGLVVDDAEHLIMLVPRKRWSLGVAIYFQEDVGEAIVDILAARLPMHEQKLDPIERIIRILRI